jgi:hypothetical protein
LIGYDNPDAVLTLDLISIFNNQKKIKMNRFYLVATALFLTYALTGIAQTTIEPTDDMTVNEGASGMFPTDDQLWIANWSPMQNYHQTYFKFDLTEYAGQTLEYATLKIYQFFHAPDGSPTPSKVFAITEDWDESSWPANTSVSMGNQEYAAPEFTSELGWYEIDVTDLANEWLDGTTPNYGLALCANPSTKFAQFYSKDATNPVMHPYLEVESTSGVGLANKQSDIANFLVYPNPLSGMAEIIFNLASNQSVNLSLYTMTGSLVKHIYNGNPSGGQHRISFSDVNIVPGVYILKLRTETETMNKKIIVE